MRWIPNVRTSSVNCKYQHRYYHLIVISLMYLHSDIDHSTAVDLIDCYPDGKLAY